MRFQFKLSDVIAIALLVLVAIAAKARERSAPVVVVPECQAVTDALRGRPAEAERLAAFYRAAAAGVERDGQGARILTTKQQLRTAIERAAIFSFQGDFVKVPGLSDAIHGPNGALAKLLGLDAGALDHAAAAKALRNVADACEAAL